MPVGFCCTKCYLYNEMQTCLKTSSKAKTSKIEPISAEIKDGVLKVVVKKGEKEVPLVIDLDKQLGSE
jgi:coenzyme F420-reducing hydrogenase beta subunit